VRRSEDLADTAQGYRNEGEVGVALHESGLSRGEVFITTKYSGFDGLDIPTSIRNSVNNVSDLVHWYNAM
jgi:diketogulonate reductase-like aldo/keto reductase